MDNIERIQRNRICLRTLILFDALAKQVRAVKMLTRKGHVMPFRTESIQVSRQSRYSLRYGCISLLDLKLGIRGFPAGSFLEPLTTFRSDSSAVHLVMQFIYPHKSKNIKKIYGFLLDLNNHHLSKPSTIYGFFIDLNLHISISKLQNIYGILIYRSYNIIDDLCILNRS